MSSLGPKIIKDSYQNILITGANGVITMGNGAGEPNLDGSKIVAITGAQTIGGNKTFSNAVVINGVTTLGNTAVISGTAFLGGTAVISGAANISGTTTINGAATFNNATVFNNSITSTGAVSIGSRLSSSFNTFGNNSSGINEFGILAKENRVGNFSTGVNEFGVSAKDNRFGNSVSGLNIFGNSAKVNYFGNNASGVDANGVSNAFGSNASGMNIFGSGARNSFGNYSTGANNFGVYAKENYIGNLCTGFNDFGNSAKLNYFGLNATTTGLVGGGTLNNGNVYAGGGFINSGAAILQGTAHSNFIRTNAGSLGTSQGNTLNLFSIGFQANNQSSLSIQANRLSNGSDWQTSAIGLSYNVDNTSGVNNQQIWMHPNGNVGIGTSSPSKKLTVNGDLDINGIITAGSVNINGIITAGGVNLDFREAVYLNPGNDLSLTQNGFVDVSKITDLTKGVWLINAHGMILNSAGSAGVVGLRLVLSGAGGPSPINLAVSNQTAGANSIASISLTCLAYIDNSWPATNNHILLQGMAQNSSSKIPGAGLPNTNYANIVGNTAAKITALRISNY